MYVRAFGAHHSANVGELFRRVFAGILIRDEKDLFAGKRGTVVPDKADQVLGDMESAAFFLCESFQLTAESGVDHPPVKAQSAPLGESGADILRHGRHAFLPHAEKGDAGALELLSRLQKIPAVGPKPGFGERNDGGPGRAGEARDKPAGFEVLADIFRLMKIRGRDDIDADVSLFHFPAQPGKSFGDHSRSPHISIFYQGIQTDGLFRVCGIQRL